MGSAVAYYRVSTNRQEESGLGLEAQRQAVYYYAQTNNIRLVKEFTETESGRKSNRPTLKKALRYCRKYKTLLIIAKLDRLGRNVAFISALMESNIKFVAADNPNANEFMIHVMAAFAQYEHGIISTRIKEALAATKKRGIKLGMNGKNLAQQNKQAADDFAKQMMPIIEQLQTEGFTSIRKIVSELNKRNIKTFRGGYKWQKTSVHNLLRKLRHAELTTRELPAIRKKRLNN